MPAAETAKLLASLDLDTSSFRRKAAGVSGDLGKMESGFGRLSTKSIAFGAAAGVAIERLAERGIGFLVDQVQTGTRNLEVLQDAQAQTAAAIESTGGKAQVTAGKVRELAESLENLTTVDDKNIQQGENLLLTFTNIGKDVFPAATKAAVDMAVALNKGNAETADVSGTAIQLGKALNDPVRGLTALRRVGVSFTKAQEDQIRALVKAGKVEEAQKVILAELGVEFGKAGEAAGKSGAAGVRRLRDAVEDSQVALATGLAPALERIRGKITEALANPKTQEDLRHLGEWLGDAAEKGLAFAESIPWGAVGDGLRTAAGFAGRLIDAFANMPPQVQGTLLALGGLTKLTGGAPIKIGVDLLKGGLGKLFERGATPANPMWVASVGGVGGGGGVPGAPVVAGGGGGLLGFLKTALPVALAGLAVGELVNTQQSISAQSSAQAATAHETLKVSLASSPPLDDLRTKMAAVDSGIRDIQSNPLNVLVAGDALDQLRSMKADIATQVRDFGNEQIGERLATLSDHVAPLASKTDRVYQGLEDNRAAIRAIPAPVQTTNVSVNVQTYVSARDITYKQNKRASVVTGHAVNRGALAADL